MRLLIAGGGTGGHLFPGVALAEVVRERGGEVLFVGTERGIEARVLPEEGWPVEFMEVRGIKGGGLRGLIAGVARLPGAWLQARSILRRFRPELVVGVGGYASGPIVATAALSGLPTAILEQNSFAGLTNRILGRLVRRVFTTFEDRRGDFPPTKCRRLGNPIRGQIVARLQAGDAELDQSSPGARPPRLFVYGGSQGARPLNRAIAAAAPELARRFEGIEILHQCGKADLDAVREAYAEAGLKDPRVRVESFIRDMASAYAWADVALCRAGATSLAELAIVGLPAVLVPFPQAADDHQTANAMALVEAGAARLLPQSELETAKIVQALEPMLGAGGAGRDMGSAMRACGRPNAAREIIDELISLRDEG